MDPNHGPFGPAVPVVISGDHFAPRPFADFQNRGRSSVSASFQARLGSAVLSDVRLRDDGALSAMVPADLAPGTYDLFVVDPWRVEGTLKDAYHVRAPGEADPTALVFVTLPRTALAGQCSEPLVLGLRDVDGGVATAATVLDVKLVADPATEFALFSDVVCTSSAAQVSIPSGESTASSFHFSGTRVGTTQVTASAAGFTSAEQVETIQKQGGIKLIQTGTATLPPGQVSARVPISQVYLDRSFLVFSVQTTSVRPSNGQVRGQLLTNPTALEFVRYGAALITVDIHWYVAEFASGASVQRSTTPFLNGQRVINAPLSPAVDLTKTFALASFSTDGTEYNSNDFVRVKFTSPTNLEMSIGSDPAPDAYVDWQVVTLDSASVQSGDLSFAAGETAKTAPVTNADLSKSFVLATWHVVGFTNPAIGPYFVRARLQDEKTAAFDRERSGVPLELSWFAVTLNDGSRVLGGDSDFDASKTSVDVNLPASVDTTRSIAFLGGNQRFGSTPHLGDRLVTRYPGVAWFTSDLTTTTNLRLTRAIRNSPATAAWFVVEFARSP